MSKYQRLIEQGVPPAVAAQTIYNQLNNDDPSNIRTVSPESSRPVVAQEKRPLGRKVTPNKGGRAICAGILKKSYEINAELKIPVNDLRDFVLEQGADLSNLSQISVQRYISRLRCGKMSGFPSVEVEGPITRMWDGKYQDLLIIHPRNKVTDLKLNRIDKKKVPSWALE